MYHDMIERKTAEQMKIMERYWLWLCSCPGLYRPEIAGLMAYFHDPEQLYSAPARELMKWKRLADDETLKWVNSLINYRDTTTLSEAEEMLERRRLRFVSRQSAHFPKKLLNLPDCPYGLFFRGSLPDAAKPSVAVVGARQCSNYGRQMSVVLGKALAQEGYQVISGMAAGVDSTAQNACLNAGGSTFAVLGSGADVCYPPENASLFEKLENSGGVISEYAPMTPPLRFHFPMRNRLISGMSDAVIVVEARAKSGSLITADLALDQGKEVFAVPGRFNDLLSYGCNRLIEQGAGIVLSTDSLLKNLAVSLDLRRIVPEDDEDALISPGRGLEGSEKKVYDNLGFEAKSIDEIALASGLTLLDAMQALLNLQLKNMAAEVSKNRYIVKIAS